MQKLTTKTEIRTEFAGMGKKPDGTWRKITASQSNEQGARQLLEEQIADANKYPDVFTKYDEYKVMKRTIITTFEDWGEL